jgi:hypothetical protein
MPTIKLIAVRFLVRTAHPTNYETRNNFAAFASSRLYVEYLILVYRRHLLFMMPVENRWDNEW